MFATKKKKEKLVERLVRQLIKIFYFSSFEDVCGVCQFFFKLEFVNFKISFINLKQYSLSSLNLYCFS